MGRNRSSRAIRPSAMSGPASATTTLADRLELPVEFIGRSQLFGVDTLAVVPGGHDLYVSNMTLSGAKAQIQVVDLTTNVVTRTIAFDNVLIPGDSDETESLPTGLYFSMFR